MSQTKITVAGKLSDPRFHKCKAIALSLSEKYCDQVSCEVMEFFETQWDQFLHTTAKRLKGVFYEHSASPLVYLNECEYVGDGAAF